MKNYDNVDEYIADFSDEKQQTLQKIRKTIKDEATGALETMSYGMPTFKLNGKNLVHFAAFKEHFSLFPTPSAIVAFRNELKPYKLSKGTIQFQNDQKIPYDLIKKIVEFRVHEQTKK